MKVLAAVNMPTDLITTSGNGVGYLPLRMVDNAMMEEINNGNNAALSRIQQKRNTVVLSIHKLYALNRVAMKLIELSWRRVGVWDHPRKNAALIFDNLTHESGLIWLDTISTVLFFLLLPSSKIEYAAWVVFAYYYLSLRLLAYVGLLCAILFCTCVFLVSDERRRDG